MRNTFFYTILLLVLGTYLGCHKDPPDQDCPPGLPCATQTGENTFGCYINGKAWVAEIAPNIIAPDLHRIEAHYDETNYSTFHNNVVHISGSRHNDTTDGFIAINLAPVSGIGSIRHENLNLYNVAGVILKLQSGVIVDNLNFKLDTSSEYNIEITYLNTLVSGYNSHIVSCLEMGSPLFL